MLLTADLEFRSYDGASNNLQYDEWGAANTPLLRMTSVEYGEGTAGVFPALAPRLDAAGNTIDARTVSNRVFDQDESVLNRRGLTGLVFQWGQFLDHDMDLTEDFEPVGQAALPGEFIPIVVTDPTDELYDPNGIVMIPVLRSRFELDSSGIAQQINQITSYIDASNVYGSDGERAHGLRAGIGGFLLTSDGFTNRDDGAGEFLPRNVMGLENASPSTTGTGVPIAPEDLFVAGDVRSNEQPGLTALHTLFVLEHNYQARRLANDLGLDEGDLAIAEVDEYLFQVARAIVGAEVQSITYNEFLPALLGPDQLASYSGYREDVNAGIANIFSGSLYRVGHTMLPNELLVLDADGSPVPDDPDVLGASVEDGEVALGEAFFNPQLVTRYGIEPFLKGLAELQIEEIDNLIVDGVRNLLFDPPAALDLGATNIQRGRDHGLPDYNQARLDMHLEPATSFSDITSDAAVVAALENVYDAANGGLNGYDALGNIDVFAGAVSEDHLPGSSVGELIHTVLVDQFTRLRDGDRFYFERVFRGRARQEIQETRLSDIVRRNTDLQHIQNELFRGHGVFTFRAPEGQRAADLTMCVRDGQIQVLSGRQVLAAHALAETNAVVVFGTSHDDRIQISSSLVGSFGGSIELHGGGGSDRLVVGRSDNSDEVTVGPSEIRVGDLSITYGNFEKIHVKTRGGPTLVRQLGMSARPVDGAEGAPRFSQSGGASVGHVGLAENFGSGVPSAAFTGSHKSALDVHFRRVASAEGAIDDVFGDLSGLWLESLTEPRGGLSSA